MTVPIMAEPIGTTRALQEVSIRARVRGFLKEGPPSLFQEGSDVKKGQLLYVIDEQPFQAAVAAAQASLDEARAELEQAEKSQIVAIAQARLLVGQAALYFAQLQESRDRRLLERVSLTREEYEESKAKLQQADADVQAKKADVEQARVDFRSQIALAKAKVAKGVADLSNAELDLSYCRMSSPIDGRVGFSEVQLGNLVGPATSGGGADYTELVVVRQLDPMGVDMQVASRYLDRVARLIERGLPVEVFRPGLEGEEARRFPGRATTIDNTINPTTSTFLIRAEVANPARTILPGEYVKSVAKVGEARDAIVVPEQAVVETQAGPTVYTVDPRGKVAITPVRATFTHEGLRVLESGLEPGQLVIVEGMQLVRAGMTVKTRPASPDTPAEARASVAQGSDRVAGKGEESAQPGGSELSP